MLLFQLMRHAARAAGFDCRRHGFGFTGVLNDGPGAPLMLLCFNTGEFEIRGKAIHRELYIGRGYAAMTKALRAAQGQVRHCGVVSGALADGGFVIEGDDRLVAHVDASEAARGPSLRIGDRIEFWLMRGGAAFGVMLAERAEPRVDDRHLLDGVATRRRAA